MTKMADLPICLYMVKTFENLLLWNRKADYLETWYAASSTQDYQVCLNDAPGLTLICFMARSNLVPYAFVWENVQTVDFSETVVVYE